jgi:voltage-gated potassium channel
MLSKKRELLVTTFTAVSVGIIVFQLVNDLPLLIEYIIYVFDLIVIAILITDFYLRMKESNENKRIFMLKHIYEIPALIPLVVFGILENYAYLNVVFRLVRLIRIFRIIHLSSSFIYLQSDK